MQYSKAEYNSAKQETLIEGDPPRLTDAGKVVAEYGIEQSLSQLELDEEQREEVILNHFPDHLDRNTVKQAVNYYEASGLFSDDELSDV